MARGRLTDFDRELGKAVCDRLGLTHSQTLREWSAEKVGKSVMVQMTTIKMISAEDYAELRNVAERRAVQGGAAE